MITHMLLIVVVFFYHMLNILMLHNPIILHQRTSSIKVSNQFMQNIQSKAVTNSVLKFVFASNLILLMFVLCTANCQIQCTRETIWTTTVYTRRIIKLRRLISLLVISAYSLLFNDFIFPFFITNHLITYYSSLIFFYVSRFTYITIQYIDK